MTRKEIGPHAPVDLDHTHDAGTRVAPGLRVAVVSSAQVAAVGDLRASRYVAANKALPPDDRPLDLPASIFAEPLLPCPARAARERAHDNARMARVAYLAYARWEQILGRRGLSIIASVDATPHGDLLHVSLAWPHRLPEWREVRAVQRLFFEARGLDCAMILPTTEDYVNLHEYCFHLHQLPEKWGMS